MTDLQRNQLNKAIGVPYSYNGKNIIIDRFKEVGGTNVVVFANGQILRNFLRSEIDQFLSDLCEPTSKEITPKQVFIPEQKLKTFEPTKENETIKETLMETLKKVKEDASYIPQAAAVCNVVSQLVNVQKTEIQMIQILKKK